MKYYDTFADAQNKLEKVLVMLEKNQLAYNPVNYAISYEYVSNKNQELKKLIDEALENNQSDSYFFETLHNEFFTHRAPAPTQNITNLNSTIDTLSNANKGSGSMMENINNDIEKSIEQVNKHEYDELIKTLQSVQQQNLELTKKQSQLTAVISEAESYSKAIKQELVKAKEEAITDPLTQLLNRKGLEKNYKLWSEKPNDFVLSAINLDIDKFKNFNDTYGHLIGDVLLRRLAKLLSELCLKKGMAFRLGGEEFIIFLPNQSLQEAAKFAEDIRVKVESLKLVNAKTKKKLETMTVSLGVAERKPQELLEDILHRSDEAMYRAKNGGRNQVQLSK